MREPGKAKLHDHPFSDSAWVFERKLDVIRAIVHKTSKGVTLTSRTGKELTSAYPELVEALSAALLGNSRPLLSGRGPGSCKLET
jgi:ATP-dependent DNA ligase